MIDDDDDDSSEEGAVVRDLFRSSSSSSSDESEFDDHRHMSNDDDVDPPPNNNNNDDDETVWHMDGTVLLVRETDGAEIAQKLWSCASYLATFVLEHVVDGDDACSVCVHGTSTTETATVRDAEDGLRERRRLVRLLHGVGTRCTTPGHGDTVLPVLELGAGVGLTGIKLATELSSRVSLTDLSPALPLLRRNVALNAARFVAGTDAVTAATLAWGDDDACARALSDLRSGDAATPVLVLASDCAYYRELHRPFEETLAALLSSSDVPDGSVCLVAVERRWKRDNAFVRTLGRRTSTDTHALSCVCVDETLRRDDSGRTILRIYAVRWAAR